ncbi:MAG: acyltransferase [Proteobacteria bacterium]|nr:acyltransferase [Pseudomonadota bacterium]
MIPGVLRFESKRVFGLDVIRAFAVALVVMSHMVTNGGPPLWLRRFTRLGTLGVETFFVLSGFLIGGIVIDLVASGRFRTLGDLGRFWTRRWLRTLPLYFLFLTIYLWFDWKGPARLREHLEYLVFLQNFAWKMPPFYNLSWSLAVEEHFYLLFPLACWILHRWTKNPLDGVRWTIGAFLIAPLAVKFALTPQPGWSGFNDDVRMVVLPRLDSLMYGVAAAFVKRRHGALWQAVLRKTPLWAALLAAECVYLRIDMPGLFPTRVWETLFFPVMSLVVALLLPAFDAMREAPEAAWARLVTYVSTVSYSIYLGHVLILLRVNAFLKEVPGGWSIVWEHPIILWPLYLVFIMALATLTYYGWERPFLALRDQGRSGVRD